MSKLKEALWHDYEESREVVLTTAIDTAEYEKSLEERDKIRKELIELEKVERDTEIRYEQIDCDKEVKLSQIESENKKEKIRNAITIGTFLTTTVVSLGIAIKSFKFDESSTFTSTIGRGTINNWVSKIFKR